MRLFLFCFYFFFYFYIYLHFFVVYLYLHPQLFLTEVSYTASLYLFTNSVVYVALQTLQLSLEESVLPFLISLIQCFVFLFAFVASNNYRHEQEGVAEQERLEEIAKPEKLGTFLFSFISSILFCFCVLLFTQTRFSFFLFYFLYIYIFFLNLFFIFIYFNY